MIRRPPRSTLFPLHDALPIWSVGTSSCPSTWGWYSHALIIRASVGAGPRRDGEPDRSVKTSVPSRRRRLCRSEEHTSELQSQSNLVCRLLLEKKKNNSTSLYRLIELAAPPPSTIAQFPAQIL